MASERITINPEQMGGLPCIRGLRIPVTTVIGQLAAGQTPDEILDEGDQSSGPLRRHRVLEGQDAITELRRDERGLERDRADVHLFGVSTALPVHPIER